MTANHGAPAQISRGMAWRNAAAITLLGCVMGAIGFVWLGPYLVQRFDLFHAAIVQYLAFAGCLAVIQVVIVIWLRRRGESYAAIAERLRVNEKTVATWVRRGSLELVQQVRLRMDLGSGSARSEEHDA